MEIGLMENGLLGGFYLNLHKHRAYVLFSAVSPTPGIMLGI